MYMIRFVVLCIASAMLLGCSVSQYAKKVAFLRGDRNLEGAQIDLNIQRSPGEQFIRGSGSPNSILMRVDIIQELDPSYHGCKKSTARDKTVEKDCSKLNQSQRMAKALEVFRDTYSSRIPESKKLRRNEIQDRVMLASNAACDEFKRHLLAVQSEVNFTLGSLATTAAGLGAIFTDPTTVRSLSGAAAILSGVRAEYNDAFYRRLVAEAITRGINSERDSVYKVIASKKTLPYNRYTIEAAIGDAIQYNSRCTLIAGFENVQKSQQFFKDPGLGRLAELLGVKTSDIFTPLSGATGRQGGDDSVGSETPAGQAAAAAKDAAVAASKAASKASEVKTEQATRALEAAKASETDSERDEKTQQAAKAAEDAMALSEDAALQAEKAGSEDDTAEDALAEGLNER